MLTYRLLSQGRASTYEPAAVGAAFFFTTYQYQKSLGIPFRNNLPGFPFFFLFFPLIQSTASLQGYCIRLLGRKGEWK